MVRGTRESMPTIIVHKDKTVILAIARLNEGDQRSECKLVGQVDPMNLKDPAELQTLSGLLKGETEGNTTVQHACTHACINIDQPGGPCEHGKTP